MREMTEVLKEMQNEVKKYGYSKVFGGKWTLRELAKKVQIFNNSERKDSLECRRVIGEFMHAAHITEIRISGIYPGHFESLWQIERNGPMIGGRRNYMIDLDWTDNALVIRKRQERVRFTDSQWVPEHIIHFSRIKRIKIVRVPAGLRHLEIELHAPCPD